MLKRDIKSIVQQTRRADGSTSEARMTNGWSVRVTSVAVQGTGAHRAWKYLYQLVDADGRTFGGYDRADSFIAWAADFMKREAR